MLTPEEKERYARHLVLPEVGARGQEKLKKAKVLCVGVGGLGSPVAAYLASAGVGTLGLVDSDRVEASNLQRQILYGTPNVGNPKVHEAARRLREMNSEIRIETHEKRLAATNVREIIRPYDIVVDGTDNFPTRYALNDACVLENKPNVYGSVFRFEGRVSVFSGSGAPCFRCAFPEPPGPGEIPSCEEGGVLGVLPGIVGTFQAAEVLKLILGIGVSALGRLLLFDALEARWREWKVTADPDCALCGSDPSIREPVEHDSACGQEVGGVESISPEILASRLEGPDETVLIDVREPEEHALSRIPGSTLIPLGDLERRFSEIPKGRTVYVHCKSGARSRRACEILVRNGFPSVVNLEGGIEAWEAIKE